VAELTVDDVTFLLPAGRARLLEVEVEAKGPGRLELDPDGRVRPAAHDRIAEFLAQNSA
jgi:hypothetical protein